jgi:phytoene synthase
MTPQTTTSPAELAEAYALCRAIAKSKAKNFYYAFVALPPARRDAICAIYAFMRRADDIADDPVLPRDERRRQLDEWFAAWQRAHNGEPTGDLVFLAVSDAIARFEIPVALLEQLVAGVATDLRPASNNEPDTYATFKDLYEYCYLVASVVGLVCIHIFGYNDPSAEKLAEETGIAFQLTNILRDVAEDAGNHRVYLPLEYLKEHGVSLESLLQRAAGAPPTPRERALLAAIGERAEAFYRSAEKLLPLISAESRPALWVLVTIYHGLLKRIRRADYDVFSSRASVPRVQKLGILAVGQARMALARMPLRREAPANG